MSTILGTKKKYQSDNTLSDLFFRLPGIINGIRGISLDYKILVEIRFPKGSPFYLTTQFGSQVSPTIQYLEIVRAISNEILKRNDATFVKVTVKNILIEKEITSEVEL